jgi:hypothetical protein
VVQDEVVENDSFLAIEMDGAEAIQIHVSHFCLLEAFGSLSRSEDSAIFTVPK